MVINGKSLIEAMPIKNMLTEKHKLHGVSHGLAEVGYDIRVKQDICFNPARYHFLGEQLHPITHTVDQSTPTKGNFCLASAMEEFDMPNDLMGIVHDKSTWARQGLSVFNTVIEPGWNGFLTLELAFHGSEPLHIPAGSGIAQVIFHRIAQPAAYTGKYQSQANEPVPSVFE
jgi:dCTP deaminase